MTGGIVDVAGVYECLVGIYTNRADPSILDIYSDIRRKKYQEIVDPISSSNLRRMFSVQPDKVLETDEFLQMCKKAATDPKLASEMLQVSRTCNPKHRNAKLIKERPPTQLRLYSTLHAMRLDACKAHGQIGTGIMMG